MNKRQAKKMRRLRLENERLREMQRVGLETEFALQQTNARMDERMDDLHEEIYSLRHMNWKVLRALNELAKQQEYLYQKAMTQQRETQQTIVRCGELKRRVCALEKVDRQAAMLAYVAGAIAILAIMAAVL